jgi:hydrogenase maturation protein HypF
MTTACSVRVRGVVQGVGFRPFVYRLARENTLAGWVLNAGEGVEMHLEGADDRLDAFLSELRAHAPPAASITAIDVGPADVAGLDEFVIRDSRRADHPTARIAPDLGVCDQCVRELFDPADPRYGYPYINCTECGPRYSIVLDLPYDRAATTMARWEMDDRCASEYADPLSRRFHAQPIACHSCGPRYQLQGVETADVVARSAALLRDGEILAVKGIGGYHLVCDARNGQAVASLRERKYRKEKPFAVMVRDLDVARTLAMVSDESRSLLLSSARPIVLMPATADLSGVAPECDRLGIMLPYTPLHHLLFAAGAPDALVMTSANRSSEPLAYREAEAIVHLAGIADGFLIGERPIARRVEDSVVRAGPSGTMILRRSRGYAPGAVAALPVSRPVLALGADVKNTVTLVVDGQAFVSQHIGDLDHYEAFRAFQETIGDLLRMYQVRREDLLVVRDAHPEYRSSAYAPQAVAVQHHRAHVASVVAERGAWDRAVLGVALDGTGFGDDGTIWGGELFVGSVAQGFQRVAHLRAASLVGGDAAARHPVQAAAGFLHQLDGAPELESSRYRDAVKVLRSGTRTFTTTSVGRLFDAVAAILGFTWPVTFEGQAAIWLEQQARTSAAVAPYPFPFTDGELDFRPLLGAVLADQRADRRGSEIARAFHAGFAVGLGAAIVEICRMRGLDTVVASGGVFQNELILQELSAHLEGEPLDLWTNHLVPPNDGGISLGQAALAAFAQHSR